MLEGNTSFQWKETLRGDEKKKKSFIPKFFSARDKKRRRSKEGSFDPSMDLEEDLSFSDAPTILRKSFSDPEITSRLEKMNINDFTSPMSNTSDNLTLRAFVATWNVGGKTPHSGLTLDNFLGVEDESDIYVLGFQEIVPLNAGNVLVIEDNEPAVKWLALINEALNKPQALDYCNSLNIPPACDLSFSSLTSFTRSSVSIDSKLNGGKLFFQKRSLKSVSKNFRMESGKRLKTCNCHFELEKKYTKDSCFRCQAPDVIEEYSSSEEDDNSNNLIEIDIPSDTNSNQMKYGLVACKQMVGIFVTIWARKELVQHIGHLRVSCIGRGIMGRLGNKGCISVSMSLYQTNLCFVCSHLASGEKEGDELRRNSDVIEILKNTQFRKICKTPGRRNPEGILDHDRIIWLGDLNYRIGLSYLETRKFLEENNWDALLEKDQLKKEREAGRVFNGWQEGKIYFAPTYKYSNNSDNYAGETIKSKKKRRTPAWCDRILWHGEGIEQLLYIRGESRFSDHRPVCAVFSVNIREGKSKKGLNTSNMKVEVEELLPPSNTFSVLNKL